MRMRTSWPSAPVPGGFAFPLGFALSFLLIVAAMATGVTSHPHWALIALVLLVAAISAVTTAAASLATACVVWGLYASFVVGQHGDLVVNALSVRAGEILALTALSAMTLATGIRVARTGHTTSTGHPPTHPFARSGANPTTDDSQTILKPLPVVNRRPTHRPRRS